MIKRSTWIALVVMALLIAAYFIFQDHPFKPSSPTPTFSSPAYLITRSGSDLQSVRISDRIGNIVQLQRDPSRVWVITAPVTAVADQGLAGAAETQIGSLNIITRLASPSDLASMGLDKPGFTMNLVYADGADHKIEVGNLTPTSSGYFIRLDSGDIYVVRQFGLDSLLNLLKSPPFPPTETPAPTETPVTP